MRFNNINLHCRMNKIAMNIRDYEYISYIIQPLLKKLNYY